jgi:hypothetical protein
MESLEQLQRFEARLDLCMEEMLYDPTKFSISTGDDAVLDDIFSYQVYNKIKNHWAAATAPTDVQQGMIWYDTDDDRIYIYDGAISNEVAQITGGMAGILFINDNANTDMTTGLTINQGGADNAIVALKSSDVTHGVTAILETDTYGTIGKVGASEGGVLFRGLTEGEISLELAAIYTTDDTNKDGTADAPVLIEVYKKSGTGVGSPGADANLFVICKQSTAVFIVDEDGDVLYDGGTSAFDEYDDAIACRDLGRYLNGLKQGKKDFGDFLKYNRDALIEMGVISPGNFVSTKAITSLMLGAISQLNEKNKTLENKIGLLENNPFRLPVRIT